MCVEVTPCLPSPWGAFDPGTGERVWPSAHISSCPPETDIIEVTGVQHLTHSLLRHVALDDPGKIGAVAQHPSWHELLDIYDLAGEPVGQATAWEVRPGEFPMISS